MRLLIGVSAILALLLSLASPAAALCRPPAPLAENAARAVAVVYGTVTRAGGGAVTLRIDRVLKGNAGGALVVFVGPGRGGAGGTAVMTSNDYRAAVGSDHVLYLIRGDDDQLETNACIGSHAGSPTAAEVAYFSGSASPEPRSSPGPGTGSGTPPPETVPDAPTAAARVDLIGPALFAILVGTVLVFVVGKRRLDARRS